MLLDLIYGGPGSGKTGKCIELTERILKKNPECNVIIIVPDQYSYAAEKKTTEHFGGFGPNGIEVLTFSQLFKRYLKPEKDYLLPSGKRMLICKAAEKACDADGIFSHSVNKPGFTAKLAELISEFKHYMITPEVLRNAAGDDEGIMPVKLRAAADIYEEYTRLLEKDFSDSEDDSLRLAEFVRTSGEFENTHVFFDGFADFLPQHYEVITAFAEHSAAVHVTVFSDGQSEIYETAQSMAKRLKSVALSRGIRICEQKCSEKCLAIKSPELLHLAEHWTNKRYTYDGETKDISLFAARDLYSETEYIARVILKEVKNGMSFSDIGVMCADTDKYEHLAEAVFGDLGIPYYIDGDLPVTGHPMILTVAGIFDIIEENWSYETVFRWLRTGFVYDGDGNPYDRKKIDILENYVLRHGIRGKKAWFSQWEKESAGVFDSILGEYAKTEENLEEINAIREEIIKPFERFYEKGKGSVRDLSEALFDFLCDINLYTGIKKEVDALNQRGDRNAAERMKEIWNILIEVINQAVVTMGDEVCSRRRYAEFLNAGFSASKLKIIPPGPDAVSIGAADRNTAARPRVMIFAGAVSGTMPTEVRNKSIFTDRERKSLEEKGVETAGDSGLKTKKEEFKFFRAVTSASERVYFSYPTSNAAGEALTPSAFLKALNKIFPKLTKSDDLLGKKTEEISSVKEAFLYIMEAVSDKSMQKNARILADFYKEDDYLSSRLYLASKAAEYKKNAPRLTTENARLLYNDYHRYSVSRLNDYAACPFSYYIKHGLKARERDIRQIQKFDIGSLLHWAVCEYCREVDGGAENVEETKKRWHELTEEKSLEIIFGLTADISARVLRGLPRDREKIAYLIERMRRILVRSTEIIRLSLTKGAYSAICYEEKFAVDIEWNGKTVGINGVIDRVDAAEKPEWGELSLRIIDYKSGSKKFDVVAISNREDLQLAVYAIAATELYSRGALGHAAKGMKPATRGVLYHRLKCDPVPCGEADRDKAEELVRKSMKLDGLVITDEGNEVETAAQMDRDIECGGTSSFLKLGVTSKGDSINKKVSCCESSERFKILTDYVKKTVVALDDEIFSGRIDILPGRKKSACTYCKYGEICLYDAGADGVREEITDESAAWSRMESEGKRDGGESVDK